MSTITVINASDQITDSRAVINTNFANLNSDKIETSYLDTDTSLAANSDTKIATQRAVKTYVDTQGGANASETVRGIVEEATDAEVAAGSSTGGTGAKLFITPAKLLSGVTRPVVNVYTTAATSVGGSTTQFDITNTSGTTYRYTYDGTGTDPSFSAANYPVGTGVYFNAQNFNSANNGAFVVTGSGTNYIEVTNASGVAETNKTIGTGYILKGTAWTKPTGLKYVVVEVLGGGGGGGGVQSAGANSAGGGGGAGGYSRELIAASSLSATEAVIVGPHGPGGASGANAGTSGKNSAFGSYLLANGGTGGSAGADSAGGGGAGGSASGGDVNISGQAGQAATRGALDIGGAGGWSQYGQGGRMKVTDGDSADGEAANGRGAGGGGAANDTTNAQAGGDGTAGMVIVTEHYI